MVVNMPYIKKVKDFEGAIAEVISTELASLSSISHPAYDNPRLIAENDSVILPKFKIKRLFSDLVFNKSKFIVKNKKFLESLGEAIAFNWYIGQMDLNVTNISVFRGKCYPYDFDCCFQNIQSEHSFAKKRMKDVSYTTVNLDDLKVDTEIIKAALTTLKNSAVTVGMGDSPIFNILFEDKKIKSIQHGFQKQLIKMENIEQEKINKIIEKHLVKGDKKTTYSNFLINKNIQAKNITKEYIMQLLKQYITRIEKNGFEHGFIFFQNSRSKNREINYRLAKTYLDALGKNTDVNFDKQSILKERNKIKQEYSAGGSNVIRSNELNDIFLLVSEIKISPSQSFKEFKAKFNENINQSLSTEDIENKVK